MWVGLAIALGAAACDDEIPRVTVHTCTAMNVTFSDPEGNTIEPLYELNPDDTTISAPMPRGGSVSVGIFYEGGDDPEAWVYSKSSQLTGVQDGDELDFRHSQAIPETCLVRRIYDVTAGPSGISWSDPRADLVDARIIKVRRVTFGPRGGDRTFSDVDGSNATTAAWSVGTDDDVTVKVVECSDLTYDAEMRQMLAHQVAVACHPPPI